MDIKKYIQEIDSEILGQKEQLFKNYIEKQLESFEFTESNISQNLLNLLMMKAQVKIPTPERIERPNPTEDTEEFALLFGDNEVVTNVYTDLMVGNNVYLYGKAGTGKTYLAEAICTALLKRDSELINCNQFTSPIEIVGGQTIEGYKQGRLVLAWQNGSVLILDELPKLDPNTAGILNQALAKAASEPSTKVITKDEYDEKQLILEASEGKELGYDVKEKDGEYYVTYYPTITDGKGDKIRKNPNFCVIATGNTNMKEISVNFSGNNRQDYSLVDRFAGSFYLIDYDKQAENRLCYKTVIKVGYGLRDILDADKNLIEAVSLRTLLNFNRIYEQEGLRLIKSKYAIPPVMVNGKPMAKKFKDSVDSFIKTLPTETQEKIKNTDIERLASSGIDMKEFIAEFEAKYQASPEKNTAKW